MNSRQANERHPSSVGHVQLFTCDEAHSNRFMLLPANLRNHAFPDRYQTVNRAKKKPDCVDGGDGGDVIELNTSCSCRVVPHHT